MRGDPDSGVVGLLADPGHLLLGHLRAAGVADGAGVGHTGGGRDLDRLDPALDVAAGVAAGVPR
jgi:hypothetical protein